MFYQRYINPHKKLKLFGNFSCFIIQKISDKIKCLMLDLFRSLNRVVKEHIDSKMNVIEVWP